MYENQLLYNESTVNYLVMHMWIQSLQLKGRLKLINILKGEKAKEIKNTACYELLYVSKTKQQTELTGMSHPAVLLFTTRWCLQETLTASLFKR